MNIEQKVSGLYDQILTRNAGEPEFHQLYEAMWADLRGEVERAAQV